MRLNSIEALRSIGVDAIQAYPSVRDCPLCTGVSKLEVRSHEHIYCRACQFMGSTVDLIAQQRMEEPFATLQYLRACGWLVAKDEEISSYLAIEGSKVQLRKYFIDRSVELHKSPSPSIRSLFGMIGTAFSGDTLRALGAGVCWLSRDHLLEHVPVNKKLCRRLLSDWGRYTAIGLPVWEGVHIQGVHIISQSVTGYLPLIEDFSPRAAAFGILTSAAATTVVMDNPVAALRMNLWRANEAGTTTFVVPASAKTDPEFYAGHRTVYWSVEDNLNWTAAAMEYPTASVVLSKPFGDTKLWLQYPRGMNFARIEEIVTQGEVPHKIVAGLLAEIPSVTAAKEMLGNTRLTPVDKAKILSYALPQDFERLREYLDEGAQLLSITWDGKTVVETHQGWVCDGKLISSAILRIEEIRARGSNGEAEVLGAVIFKGKSYGFRTELTKLRKSPGEWVTRFVIDNAGTVPFMESSWKSKLLELAQQFHEPHPVFQNKGYGWDGESLRLPNFTISRHGIESLRTNSDGPQIALPSSLSPAEWNAFSVPGFCTLFLSLLGNLLRTKDGLEPYNLYLVNESHVLSRIASFIGSRVLESVSAACVRNSHAPLPTLAVVNAVNAPYIFTGEDRRHLLVSVDSHTANLLSICSKWVKIRIQSPIDYRAMRAVFFAIPEALRLGIACKGEDDDYRDLAVFVSRCFNDNLPPTSKLSSAAFDLDFYNRMSASNAATKILKLVLVGIHSKAITPEYRGECVRIPITDLKKYIRQSTVPLPTVADMTATLMASQFLIEDVDTGYWAFGRNIWDINSKIVTIEG